MTDRREFLKKLAKGTVYGAPVIYTMATPRDLMAFEATMMMMEMGMGMLLAAPWRVPPGSEPPNATPPGSTPPGSSRPGTSSSGTGN